MRHLVTGAAGFIGFHLAKRLLERGDEVVGIDSVNDYYDPALKLARLAELGIGREAEAWGVEARSSAYPAFRFLRCKLEDRGALESLFERGGFDRVCSLAAQAGVRYSLENPRAYVESNVVGFLNVLECCRAARTPHLAYASSSSVYGIEEARPFTTRAAVSHPASLYAATKRADELMAHTYSHLYGLPTTGLRFFTVYGPWGRPDMAYFKFARAIREGRRIEVYNGGDMYRDFTYIDDIVEGLVRVIDRPPRADPAWDASAADPASSSAPYRLYNIGNNNPVKLGDFIATLERKLGAEAAKDYLPMQPGDLYATEADVSGLERDFGWRPSTPVDEGLGRFAAWFDSYRGGREAGR
ncbi:MAG TPA: NAD-dependent epimerase [Spirochaetales bacterium]|nr:NAD-dependent epimerase [Spirochaetales bacterium]HRY53113.1 NAD-dependent epimerase [Spirochaetia bacterium]HRZ64670.1 NAD-dependent epimerase [Spirochaetia bacterium]